MTRHLSPEHRAAIGAGLIGRPVTPEMRAKMRAAKLGKPLSPEHRAKLSAALRGKPTWNKGVPTTPEHRAKLVEAARNHVVIGECVYCGAPAMSFDHVIPRGRPGWEDNVVPACISCNASKNQRTPDEWLADGLIQPRARR